MKPESIVLTVAGMCFGVLLGWVLATLNDNRVATAPVAATTQQEPPAGNEREPPKLDEAQVQALTTILNSDPNNAGAAAQLGELYFQAERLPEAIKWFREALRLDPKNVTASTQLGMSLFITEGAEPALAQFEQSLKIEPNHPRTLLSKGIVLWQGRSDRKGAADAWRQLVKAAPSSPEAQAAQQGLAALEGERAGGAPEGK